MEFKILVSKEAQSDLENAFLYYRENVNKKVATEFLKDFRKTPTAIWQNPYFKIWHDDFRGKLMKKHPFIIFYLMDIKENTIIVSRIFHTSQNPEKYP
ncbi:type II toxin-antitoxin system RelE/ParE family toxin [Chryseobacterium indoltheticum]|uniref:type II toxin-antitoxin system RelE/ParE family toxin n=1 Tax=Chryseobacterium indoltheticum TaxID=254 RepID=UPI003F49ACC1